MGFSLTYLAVKGKPPEIILSELGLKTTDQFVYFDEAPYCAATLPGGWYIISEHQAVEFTKSKLLKSLSLNCEVVVCFVEEHVMASYASAWQNGIELWSIEHDSGAGINHLKTKGILPPSFDSISKHLKEEQSKATANKENVDFIFSIPPSTVESIIGFTYDKIYPGLDRDAFQVLTPISQSKSPGLLKGLFNSLFPRKG